MPPTQFLISSTAPPTQFPILIEFPPYIHTLFNSSYTPSSIHKPSNSISPTTMTNQTDPPPHLLIIPFPAPGHMIPLLDLTQNLASKNTNNTLKITILTTPKNEPLLTPLITSHPSIIHSLILPYPSHPSLPTGIENSKDMPNSVIPIMLSYSNLQNSLINWFHSQSSPPNYIISDMFCGWTQHLASQLGIQRLVFSPSGAFAFSTMCYLWKELPKRSNDQNDVVSFEKIPNSPKYPWWQVSPLFRSYVRGEPDSERVKDWFLANFQSYGLVLNSFDELEKPYVDYLKGEFGNDRVWTVGPLLPGDKDNYSDRGGSSSVSVNDVVSWLDKKEDRKVVYVCFGSLTILTKDQREAIALGLLKSGVHFIWSVKEGGVNSKNEDFGERGLVIRGWAPQVMILRHRAVGAFLTHCGWNSVLESVVAGVPMLAWPMSADQFVNATLVVDELGRVLAESVSGSGEEMKRALKLKTAAVEAVKEGGSSDKDMRCLIEQLVFPLE